jgi:peptidoglycan biosynthesis protein MviN/MurJ (putative lipid II flippase)
MNPLVELNLAAILFAPWFAILGVLYWLYPRQPRTTARRWFDLGALVLAALAFFVALHWAQGWADRGYGRMWQQVVGTSVSYAAFLAVLTVAFSWRRRWLRRISGKR